MRFQLAVAYIALLLPAIYAGSLPLSPGSIVFGNVGFPSGSLYEVTQAGGALGNLALPVLSDIPESVTVLNGKLFVGDGAGVVSQIDPSTGNVINFFQTPAFGLNSLGNYNGNLIAFPTVSYPGPADTIYEYTAAGGFVQSITLQTLPSSASWSGLTSNGSVLYLADYSSGLLYEYSLTGVLLGSVDTHLGAGLIGVSFDSANDSLWVADSLTDVAYDLSESGSVLSDFATGIAPTGGIAVVPGNATPEPGSFFLSSLGAAGLLVGAFSRRRKSCLHPLSAPAASAR